MMPSFALGEAGNKGIFYQMRSRKGSAEKAFSFGPGSFDVRVILSIGNYLIPEL